MHKPDLSERLPLETWATLLTWVLRVLLVGLNYTRFPRPAVTALTQLGSSWRGSDPAACSGLISWRPADSCHPCSHSQLSGWLLSIFLKVCQLTDEFAKGILQQWLLLWQSA